MVEDKNLTTSSEENSSSTTPKKVSPYDWEALGFKVYQENDSMEKHILTGTNLMKSILDNIDKHGDGKMSEECFSRYKGNFLVRELLSKMVVAHCSEWSYSGSALNNVVVEYEQYYDSMIKKLNTDGSKKDEIQKEKDAELNRVRAKIDSLSFLSKIKLEGNSQLPENCFYYFQPQAFIEQMQRMNIDYSKYVRFCNSLESERKNIVSKKTILFLGEVTRNLDFEYITITSTIRYPRQQANAMYGTKIKYTLPGEKVKAIYADCMSKNLSKEETLKKMIAKIEELSEKGERVSLHCVSTDQYNRLNVVDISYNGIDDVAGFITKLSSYSDVLKIIHSNRNIEVSNKIKYDENEPCIHVEIKQ